MKPPVVIPLALALILATGACAKSTDSEGQAENNAAGTEPGAGPDPTGYIPDQGGPGPIALPAAWIRPNCGPSSKERTYPYNLSFGTKAVGFPWHGVSHPMWWDSDYQLFHKRIDAAHAAGDPAPTGPQFKTKPELATYLSAVADDPGKPSFKEGSSDFDALLATALLDGISANYLYEGLDARRLHVAPGPGERWTKGRQEVLALDDPWLGRFEVIVLLPKGPGPHPAIVVHPGHKEDARSHRDQRFSQEIVDAGIALAILTPRANDSHPKENDISLELLKRGTSFMSIRLYELWLIRKLMRCRMDIDPGRIGLLGHSGGAVVANMAIRIDSDWAAYVGDLTGDYLNWDAQRGTVIDETAPRAHPYFRYVNNFATAPVPMVMLTYEYGDGKALVAFLKRELAAR